MIQISFSGLTLHKEEEKEGEGKGNRNVKGE